MRDINLLPWRQNARRNQQNSFLFLLFLSALFVCSSLFVLTGYVKDGIQQQAYWNKRAQSEIKILNLKLQHIHALKTEIRQLQSRIQIFTSFSMKRIITLHLLDELIQIMPEGIYLEAIKRLGDEVWLEGYSKSHEDISHLMRNIQNNVWLQNPNLVDLVDLTQNNETRNRETQNNETQNNETQNNEAFSVHALRQSSSNDALSNAAYHDASTAEMDYQTENPFRKAYSILFHLSFRLKPEADNFLELNNHATLSF